VESGMLARAAHTQRVQLKWPASAALQLQACLISGGGEWAARHGSCGRSTRCRFSLAATMLVSLSVRLPTEVFSAIRSRLIRVFV
jgi:hypothetical protein